MAAPYINEAEIRLMTSSEDTLVPTPKIKMRVKPKRTCIA